jgi:hypothetical protein
MPASLTFTCPRKQDMFELVRSFWLLDERLMLTVARISVWPG